MEDQGEEEVMWPRNICFKEDIRGAHSLLKTDLTETKQDRIRGILILAAVTFATHYELIETVFRTDPLCYLYIVQSVNYGR